MQYKVYPIDPVWNPIDVQLIRLWKANPDAWVTKIQHMK
jgi:hypothetical protein